MKINYKTRMAIMPDGSRIPVLDAKFNFIVQPNEEDIQNAIPGDPERCMYSLYFKRMHKSAKVWVVHEYAYVELKNKHGKSELIRFALSDAARAKAKEFDTERDVNPTAVIFAAPTKSRRLDAQAAYRRAYAERRRKGETKRAYVRGIAKEAKKGQPPTALIKLQTARDPASGLFQFKHRP